MPFPGIPDPQVAGIPTPPAPASDLLRGALAPLVDPVDAALHAILEYGRLLLSANTVTNLTGAKDWETLVEAHLLDCVLAARFLPDRVRTLFDWGSGGGLPGLVWAGIFPERHFHLCERNQKKAEFLQEAVSALGYMHVAVHQGQGEEVVQGMDPRADLIVARAVEPLPKFLRRLARPNVPAIGLLLMAGRSWEKEWEGNEELQATWHLDRVDRYPLSEARGDRFALHMRRRAR